MKKNTPRSKQKPPAATLDLKAKEVSKGAESGKSDKNGKKNASQGKTTGTSGKTASARLGSTRSGDRKAPAGKGDAAQKKTTGSPVSPAPGENGASRKGGGFFSHLLASVIGAVLGVFGLSYASNQNMLPAPLQLTASKATLERIDRLNSKIARLERTTSPDTPDGIGARLARLDARLQKAEQNLGATAPGAATLAQKVEKLETTIGNLEQAARTGKGGKLAGLTAVTAQLAKANRQSLALKTELVKVREEQNSLREDLTSIRSKQADFTTTTAKIADELAKMKNSTAKIAANASRPPDVSAQINPVLAQLGELSAKIDGVLNREASSKAEGRDIALALSLGELKRAVNEGVPFRTELARVMPHAPRGLDLSPLSQYADKGLVTASKLRESFASYSNKALAAEHTAPSGSLVDQILANAKSMVQVRPTGLVKGDDTGAVLARMEYKLTRNDLAGALAESKALTGRAKEVMHPWLEQAGARLGGDTVLRTLEDKIRNALAGNVSN